MLAHLPRLGTPRAASGRVELSPAGPSSLAGFVAVTVAAVMLWPAIDPGLHTFYDRTIAYQAGRNSPFSIWGQVPALEPLRIAILAAVGALASAPRLPAPAQVAGPGRGARARRC